MELRSSRRKNEYNELKITLNGMGIYDEGMDLQEMRQVLDALQRSATESELDFMPTEDGRVLNSTMMSIHPNISPCSSPDIPSERIVVQAEVHHAIDWSPPNERLLRKRVASACMVVDNANISAEFESNDELLQPYAKRFHDICVPNVTINSEKSSNDSIDDSSEISTKSLHEIRSAVSQPRVYDSGFIVGHETPFSSLKNTSTDDNTPSADGLNNAKYSAPELPDSTHEILEPVSVRRIHDSGLNISAEVDYNSVVNSFIENSNICLENCLEISTSGASDPENFDVKSDPSI